jgi:Na+/H+ antiporter
VSGTFSLGASSLRFVLGAVGGVLIGLAVGWVAARVRRRVADAQLSVILSLLTAYVAYIPADVLGASGVLATVSAGLYVGVRAPTTLPAQSRLQGTVVWNLLDLVLNAILFTLVGLELHNAVEALAGDRPATLVGWALAVASVAVLVRLVWFFTVPYAVRAVDRTSVPADRRANAKGRVVVAWSGMRGAVSLAVALAVPSTLSDGAPFPGRDLIVFLTFAVILITLVVQGLTLPALIKRLGVKDPEADEREELTARLAASRAALDRLAAEDWSGEETVERLRRQYQFREARLAAQAGEKADDGYEDRSESYQRAVLEVLGAQRDALLELRQAGSLSNTTLNRLVHELDLEESRVDGGGAV